MVQSKTGKLLRLSRQEGSTTEVLIGIMGRFHTQIQTRLLSHPLPKIGRPLYFSILLLFSSRAGLAQLILRYFYVSAYYCFLLLLNIFCFLLFLVFISNFLFSYYFLLLLSLRLFLLSFIVFSARLRAVLVPIKKMP